MGQNPGNTKIVSPNSARLKREESTTPANHTRRLQSILLQRPPLNRAAALPKHTQNQQDILNTHVENVAETTRLKSTQRKGREGGSLPYKNGQHGVHGNLLKKRCTHHLTSTVNLSHNDFKPDAPVLNLAEDPPAIG